MTDDEAYTVRALYTDLLHRVERLEAERAALVDLCADLVVEKAQAMQFATVCHARTVKAEASLRRYFQADAYEWDDEP